MKSLLKIIFVSILAGGIVAAGVYAFLRLKSDEEVYRADLFSLVPIDCDFLFYSRKPENLPDHLPVSLFPDKSCFLLARSLYSECGNDVNISGNNEILLSFKGSDGLIFYRTAAGDVRRWENERVKRQEFLFSPQKETYKDATIFAYLTADDRFFCFTHYHGSFIGGFSKSMIYKALDMYDTPEALNGNASFNMAMKISGEKVLASCFFKDDHWFSFDLSYNNGNYWANGCLLPSYTAAERYQLLNMPAARHEINPEVLPETISGLVFTNTRYEQRSSDDTGLVDSLPLMHATGEMALVYYADTSRLHHRVVCVGLRDCKLFLKDLSSCISRNRKSEWYLKVVEDDDFHDRREKIYQLSPDIHLTSCFGSLYRSERADVFTFYGQYLLVADSKESLKSYLDLVESGRTFDKNPLYKLYSDNKNGDASLSVLIDGSQALQHAGCCRDIVPDYFLRDDKCSGFRAFVQFNRETDLVYYNVLLAAAPEGSAVAKEGEEIRK